MKYICVTIIMIMLLLLFQVTDTFVKSVQLALMTYIVIGSINLLVYLVKSIIGRIKK